MDNGQIRTLRGHDGPPDSPALVGRRRRIAALLSGSALIVTTALFASVETKIPPFHAD